MSRRTSIRNLQIITAFDSLSYGLIYRFMGAYLQELGGNDISIGILATGILIGDLLSPEITKIFTHSTGDRRGLFLIFSMALLTHLMMATTNSYWFAILMRVLFSAINQSQNLCLALLLDKENNVRTRGRLQWNYSILSGSGYIFGPIISGCFFEKEKGFRYVFILAALLTLLNAMLLSTVDENYCEQVYEESMEKSVLMNVSEKLSDNMEQLKKCELEKYWDILLLRYLFTTSFLIFLSKFGKILRHNFDIASSVTKGWTIAYMNTLVFASSYYVAQAKATTEHYPLVFLSEVVFFLMTIMMFLACYSPSYEFFLLLLIPVAFLRSVIMSMWKDLFSERQNQALSKLDSSAGVAAGLTIPLLFGVTCDQIGHEAVNLFTCIPMLMCWVTIRSYSRLLKIEDPVEGDQCPDTEKVKYC